MRKGICTICGNVNMLSTCQTCGALVCDRCMQEGICKNCRRGRMQKGKK